MAWCESTLLAFSFLSFSYIFLFELNSIVWEWKNPGHQVSLMMRVFCLKTKKQCNLTLSKHIVGTNYFGKSSVKDAQTFHMKSNAIDTNYSTNILQMTDVALLFT